jgi:hypothetical protein
VLRCGKEVLGRADLNNPAVVHEDHPSTCLIISGSSADVGSSNNITSGCIASARAIATRCFCPPELEHLGSADAMIVRVRRRLLAALHAFHRRGTTPPGVDTPAAYRKRSMSAVLPATSDWVEALRDWQEARVAGPST